MAAGNQPAVGGPPGKAVSQTLQYEGNDQQHNHAHIHNIRMVLILAVIDRERTDTARPDRAGHGCQSDQADGGNRGYADQVRNRFTEIYPENQPRRSAAHTPRGLHFPRINAGKRDLHLAAVKWNRSKYQRQDGAFHIDRRADNRPGQGNQEDQKDNERIMPPPERFSKPSTRRMEQLFFSISWEKQGARSEPEAQIMVPA